MHGSIPRKKKKRDQGSIFTTLSKLRHHIFFEILYSRSSLCTSNSKEIFSGLVTIDLNSFVCILLICLYLPFVWCWSLPVLHVKNIIKNHIYMQVIVLYLYFIFIFQLALTWKFFTKYPSGALGKVMTAYLG